MKNNFRLPTVSIITPLFNAERWIGETIASVQAQSLPDWEMVIVDDGSMDGGPALVGAVARGNSGIRLFHQANAGPATARNLGVKHARAPWIVFLDADDLIPPRRLEMDLAAANRSARCGVVAGGVEWFRGESTEHTCLLDSDPEINRWRHDFYSVFYFGAMTLRKDAFEQAGRFSTDSKVALAEDYDFTLRLLDREEVTQTKDIAIRIRKHEANRSTLGEPTVVAQTIEVIHRRWARSIPGLTPEAAGLAFRFWRMEPAKLTMEELREMISLHAELETAHLKQRPAARRAVRLDWERKLGGRVAEAGLTRSQVAELARLEAGQRGGLAAARLMLRWARHRRRR